MWNIFGDGPLEWSEDADAVLYARIDGPLAWQQHALCAQTDPEAFFPENGRLHSRSQGSLSGLPGSRRLP